MEDLGNKVNGNVIDDNTWNQSQKEIVNTIVSQGITPSSGDLNQFGKALAGYISNGHFYSDSGIANAYVLSVIGSKQNPPTLNDGFKVIYETSNPNTGAATANPAGLGVKSIKLRGGDDPVANDISGRVSLSYDLANDWFELTSPSVTNQSITKSTIAAAKADDDLVNSVGGYVTVVEFSAGLPINAIYEIFAGSTTADGVEFFNSDTSSLFYMQLIRPEILTTNHAGIIGDFAAIDDVKMRALIAYAGQTGQIINGFNDKTYLFNAQVTVEHDVDLDFRGAKVRLDHTGALNDSAFQMGNSTTLKNISELSYRSTSVSAFTTLGMVKIGEFYAFIGGAPNSGDNSLDSTYYKVDNVTLENIDGVSSYMTLNTDREFTSVVHVNHGTNVRTNNLSLDGLAADAIPVPALSTVRTETGYDTTIRQQGFNLIVENTRGTNLRAHPEAAVVYINGDNNTKVVNVHGENCGQIFGCNSNGDATNQNSNLRGHNGTNIIAENISGYECKRYTGDTFSKKIAAVNLKFQEPDLFNGNRSQVKVSGIHVVSNVTVADKLDNGIAINDSTSNAINTKRIIVENFEVSLFPEGLVEDTDTHQSLLENGWIHDSDANGATLRGVQSTYNRLKITNNNQQGIADGNGFNGHGINLQTIGATFNECIIGDDTISSGTETQLQGVQVSLNNTRATFNDCRIGNFKSGFNEFNLRGGITGAEIYIGPRCKGTMRSIGGSFPRSPDVVKVSASVASTGTAINTYNCASSRVSVGRYLITFDKDFDDTNYRIGFSSEGGTGAHTDMDWAAKAVGSVEIYTKDAAGTLTDADFDVFIYGNYDSQV